ncbi:MAG: hypothetical protein Q8M11_11695 [Sulfuritalea sp.]|nr:hypothetical protein [Sulfuritalea sp.]MDP1981754.1 hypothetical protein [Sulfuritalea sp.]
MDFDNLVTITRVPLADLVQKALAANGDQAAIDAAILATAEGMALAYWDGLSNAMDTGKAIECFSRATVGGVPQ